MSTYKHLFFDLDHTLWDFDANAKEALLDLYTLLRLKEAGINNFTAFYTHYLHHNSILWNRYHQGTISSEELKWKRMSRTLLEFKNGDEKLAKKMSEEFLEILPVKKKVFPYTFEILSYLTAKNYHLHLITNGFEKTQWNKLHNSLLGKYFEEVITSEASNSIKPSAAIFEYALIKTKAQLSESIMIGDSLDADIQGAMNVGMDSVFVNHIHTTTLMKPTYTVYHLKELESIF